MNKLTTYILGIVAIVVIFLSGSHLMDVGNIAKSIESGYLTNGFFNLNAVKVFHFGYYTMYLAFFAMVVLNVIMFGRGK